VQGLKPGSHFADVFGPAEAVPLLQGFVLLLQSFGREVLCWAEGEWVL
jgi:hypothetical protein